MAETRQRSFVSAQMVADLAGVSRSAVSRTFTDGASVSEATRQKVLKAADALGYHVNHLARGLIHERSDIVCLIIAEIPTPYQGRMLDVVTRRLQEIDKVGMVINTTGSPESVAAALRQTMNYRAEATVVISGAPAAALIDTCLANGQHVILINRDDHAEGPDHIAVDNDAAAREVFFLLARAGCTRLAVVSSEAGTPSLVAREQAFAEAARAAGHEASLIRLGPTGYASGAEAARLLFSRAEAPDGVFCVTDLLALGFMDAARHEFGLRVPEDLCIIGFDDIEQAGWESYNLTTFRQPVEQVADYIIDLLTQPERDPRPPRVFAAPPVWRRSVRPR